MSARHPHDVYADARADLIGRLRGLTAAQSASTVPTCPQWSVKDVAAHLSGLVAETLAGVPPPRGSDEATSRQVGDRAAMTLAEVCEEWESNSAAFAEYAQTDPEYSKLLVCDLTVHGHDIAEALGLAIDEGSANTIGAAEHYLPLLQERAADQLDIALTIELLGVGIHEATAGSIPVHLSVSPFAFLRSVTGRRTRSEVEALDWTGDPSALVSQCFSQYGPLSD